jgi:hypothetical protein
MTVRWSPSCHGTAASVPATPAATRRIAVENGRSACSRPDRFDAHSIDCRATARPTGTAVRVDRVPSRMLPISTTTGTTAARVGRDDRSAIVTLTTEPTSPRTSGTVSTAPVSPTGARIVTRSFHAVTTPAPAAPTDCGEGSQPRNASTGATSPEQITRARTTQRIVTTTPHRRHAATRARVVPIPTAITATTASLGVP